MIPFALLEEERAALKAWEAWESGADMPWLPRNGEDYLAVQIETSRKARLAAAEKALDAFYASLP